MNRSGTESCATPNITICFIHFLPRYTKQFLRSLRGLHALRLQANLRLQTCARSVQVPAQDGLCKEPNSVHLGIVASADTCYVCSCVSRLYLLPPQHKFLWSLEANGSLCFLGVGGWIDRAIL